MRFEPIPASLVDAIERRDVNNTLLGLTALTVEQQFLTAAQVVAGQECPIAFIIVCFSARASMDIHGADQQTWLEFLTVLSHLLDCDCAQHIRNACDGQNPRMPSLHEACRRAKLCWDAGEPEGWRAFLASPASAPCVVHLLAAGACAFVSGNEPFGNMTTEGALDLSGLLQRYFGITQ